MMRVITFLFLFASCSIGRLTAQIDSVLDGQDPEKLLEQSSDNSPILDVVGVPPPKQPLTTVVKLRSRIIQDLQRSVGFTDGSYIGSPLKSYQRITAMQGKSLSAGILLTKDAGEQRFNDFMSWNIGISDEGIFHKAVLGDYRIEAGEGIALWRGFGYSKGAEVVAPVQRVSRGLVTALSTDEVEYFRGLAAEVHAGPFLGIAFYSNRLASATFDTSGHVTALYASGYFRTESERTKRNNLRENLIGIRASYSSNGGPEIGFTAYRAKFSAPFLIDGGRRFSGDVYALMSCDYTVPYRSVTLFGEWARAGSTVGGTTGLLLHTSDDVSIIVSLRQYPTQFMTLHGLGFGERTATSNEHGFYAGLKILTIPRVVCSIYYDQFVFPGATSISKFSTGGNDMMLAIDYTPSEKLVASFRYQRKLTDERGDQVGLPVDRQLQQRARLEMEYRLSTRVQMRCRVERVFLDWKNTSVKEKGFLMYHDVSVRSSRRLRWNTRLVFFQTDSFDSRMYEYERDLDGVVSVPSLSGTGIRWYGVLRYQIGGHVEISAKYSDIIRDDVKHLGSGLDELPANHDNRINVQLDVTL